MAKSTKVAHMKRPHSLNECAGKLVNLLMQNIMRAIKKKTKSIARVPI